MYIINTYIFNKSNEIFALCFMFRPKIIKRGVEEREKVLLHEYN